MKISVWHYINDNRHRLWLNFCFWLLLPWFLASNCCGIKFRLARCQKRILSSKLCLLLRKKRKKWKSEKLDTSKRYLMKMILLSNMRVWIWWICWLVNWTNLCMKKSVCIWLQTWNSCVPIVLTATLDNLKLRWKGRDGQQRTLYLKC